MYNIYKCPIWYSFDYKGGVSTDCFLFKGLTETEKAAALKHCGTEKAFEKSEDFYKTGCIGILICGNALVKRKTKNGDGIVMRTMKAGEIFGAASVFGAWEEGLSCIVAKTQCRVCYINEADFKLLLKEFPQISYNYIAFLTEKLRFLNLKIDTFTADSTESRLYEYLLSIAVNNEAVLEFGMAELARRLKVGRSSLYRDIASLEKAGLISRRGNSFLINNF